MAIIINPIISGGTSDITDTKSIKINLGCIPNPKLTAKYDFTGGQYRANLTDYLYNNGFERTYYFGDSLYKTRKENPGEGSSKAWDYTYIDIDLNSIGIDDISNGSYIISIFSSTNDSSTSFIYKNGKAELDGSNSCCYFPDLSIQQCNKFFYTSISSIPSSYNVIIIEPTDMSMIMKGVPEDSQQISIPIQGKNYIGYTSSTGSGYNVDWLGTGGSVSGNTVFKSQCASIVRYFDMYIDKSQNKIIIPSQGAVMFSSKNITDKYNSISEMIMKKEVNDEIIFKSIITDDIDIYINIRQLDSNICNKSVSFSIK